MMAGHSPSWNELVQDRGDLSIVKLGIVTTRLDGTATITGVLGPLVIQATSSDGVYCLVAFHSITKYIL